MFSLTALLLVVTFTLPSRCGASPTPTSSGGSIILRDLAVPRFFGAAANTTFLFNDQNYTRLAETQFSIFTPENEMKWESIEPFPNVFNFTAADEIVNFAESRRAKVRGHNFMWGNQLAPWVNDTLSATELDRALKNHIDTIMNHYRGRLYAWDVINELISDTPNATFKDIIWTRKFGEQAMPKALTYARQADPQPKLYINDYGIEGINDKSNTLFEVAKSLKKDGVPLDGIGFQYHLTLGQVPPDIQENLQRFADLDLDVAITELDINLRGPANETALEQQAKDYKGIVSACLAVKRCVSVTIWGVSDDHSWIPHGEVLPWDGEKQPKPAFFAIAEAFSGRSTN
ncbi:glycoside hydrolase [Marasmius fiardii PR-910]|nr:glycoside hydrolase [Marasmius fiardii PR-910]